MKQRRTAVKLVTKSHYATTLTAWQVMPSCNEKTQRQIRWWLFYRYVTWEAWVRLCTVLSVLSATQPRLLLLWNDFLLNFMWSLCWRICTWLWGRLCISINCWISCTGWTLALGRRCWMELREHIYWLNAQTGSTTLVTGTPGSADRYRGCWGLDNV